MMMMISLKRSDLIETFRIINGISHYGDIFFKYISPWTWNSITGKISKAKFNNHLNFLRIEKYNIFLEQIPLSDQEQQ